MRIETPTGRVTTPTEPWLGRGRVDRRFAVGLGFVLTSGQPRIAVDLAYHLTMLVVLTAGLAVIARTVGHSRPGSGQTAAAGQAAHDHDLDPESTGR